MSAERPALDELPEWAALVAAFSDDPPKVTCRSCEGAGEVEDEGWSWDGPGHDRTYGDGIMDCGWCDGNGWVFPNKLRAAAALVAAASPSTPPSGEGRATT